MATITTTIEDSIVINTTTSQTTLDEVLEYMRENYDAWIGKSLLWVIIDMDMIDVPTSEVEAFVKKALPLAEKRAGERTALVASRDLQFGMMRVLETYAGIYKSSVSFNTFRTITEAKKWLLDG